MLMNVYVKMEKIFYKMFYLEHFFYICHDNLSNVVKSEKIFGKKQA